MIKKDLTSEYSMYLRSNARSLGDVYGKWSSRKESAYLRCCSICSRLNGSDLKIVSHNTFAFTVGFEYHTDTGELMFAYITPTYDYCDRLATVEAA